MWIKTIGGKLLNMNNVSQVSISSSVLENGCHYVTAYLANNGSVTLTIGSLEECDEYMQALGTLLSVTMITVA